MEKSLKISPTSLNGNLRRGGYLATAKMESDTGALENGRNVELKGKSGSGSLDFDFRTFFSGHAIAEPDNIAVRRYQSQATVQIGTMDRLLSGIDVQDIGFTEQASPANDHQITGLQLADIANHIPRQHSNAIFDATLTPDGIITELDIDFTNSIALNRYNVRKNISLWRAVQAVGGGEQNGEFYISYFDRRNKFFYQPFPPFWNKKPVSKGTITKEQLRNVIRVRRNANQLSQKVGQVNLTAVKDFDTVFTASFPANAAEGRILPPRDGIFAATQAETQTLATRLYKWLTRLFTITIEVDPGLILFNDDGNGMDLANLVVLDYNGPVLDMESGAGLSLDLSGNYFIFGVQVNFDVQGKMASGFLTLESDPT